MKKSIITSIRDRVSGDMFLTVYQPEGRDEAPISLFVPFDRSEDIIGRLGREQDTVEFVWLPQVEMKLTQAANKSLRYNSFHLGANGYALGLIADRVCVYAGN